MNALTIPPNVQALVVHFLRSQDEVADICDGRIGTVVPPNPVLPFVRVVQYSTRVAGGDSVSWVTTADLQIDIWSDSKESAWETAAICYSAIIQRFRGTFDFGTGVTGVITKSTVSGLRDLPDDSYAPARPRWIFSVSVCAHPVRTPDVSSS